MFITCYIRDIATTYVLFLSKLPGSKHESAETTKYFKTDIT